MTMVQLDERAAKVGVTFLDDTSDESYSIGMRGVEPKSAREYADHRHFAGLYGNG